MATLDEKMTDVLDDYSKERLADFFMAHQNEIREQNHKILGLEKSLAGYKFYLGVVCLIGLPLAFSF